MLSDTRARTAKPKEKPYKLSDGAGLYLFVRPTGSKQWRYDYSFNQRRKTLTFGTYPHTTLAEARAQLQSAKTSLNKNTDPALKAEGCTFKEVAEEWLRTLEAKGDNPNTMQRKRCLLAYAYPHIGTKNVQDITTPELLAILRRLEANKLYESTKRLRSNLSRIFRYAIATARAERDPTQDLKGALIPPNVTHRAAFTEPDDIGKLLHAIDEYHGHQTIQFALQFLALTFVRPGEIRQARYDQIREGEWHIPAVVMKMKHPHLVPLSKQALAVIDQTRIINQGSDFLFPSLISNTRPLSENTLNTALRRMGFSKEQMTSHGFRTMASTRLNEMDFHPDAIERQLAHRPKNQVRAAYNRAEYLQERRKMMQVWADYLDKLRAQR